MHKNQGSTKTLILFLKPTQYKNMKIFYSWQSHEENKLLLTKIGKIMKLFTFFFLVATLQISAKGYSQNVTLTTSNITLKRAFRQISQQTGYSFFINHKLLKDAGTVSLSLKDATITEALQACLKGQELTYTIIDKTVILKAKETTNSPLLNSIPPSHLLTGSVIDSANRTPLSGVTIQVRETTTGTTTDANGNFSLQVPDDAVLIVSFLGYEHKEIPVNGKNVINITLAATTTGLNQLVVIGYGTQKEKDLTGAISTITNRDIQNLPVRSAQEAIQGKVPGVLVTASSGSPGSLGVVHIRGIGSINGSNSPLYIVDGLPQNDVGWLDPNDIATISVLKDASSTAIYGARASNGVIIITTKKAKLDQPIRVSLDAYYGIQSPWKRPRMLNATGFINYKTLAAQNAGAPVPVEFSTPGNIQEVLNFVKTNTGSINGTDWWKEVTHYNAPIQNYNVGVTGGSKNVSVASSIGYMKDAGIILGTDYRRILWHNNIGINVSHRVTLSSNFSVVYEKMQTTGEQNPWTGTVFLAQAVDPITPVYRNNLKDVPSFYSSIMQGYEPDNPFSQYAGVLYTNKLNPVAQIARSEQNTTSNLGIKAGAAIKVKIINPLTFQSSLSMDLERDVSNGFTPSYFLNPNDFANLSTVSNYLSSSDYFVWDNILTYDQQWGNSHLTVMGGTSTELTNGNAFGASIQGTVNNSVNMRIINAGTTNPGASGYTYSTALLSFFGRINYAYKDRYILTANVRRDGSSSFGQGHEWGTFPSVSAAWRFSKESFIQNAAGLSWLNDGKLRVSYGLVGNQNVGSGAYLTTYGNTSRYLFGDVNSPSLGGGRSSVGNSSLQWETSKQLDIGLDATLFNGKLSFAADYFKKNVNNMLLRLPLPSTLGFPNNPWSNVGSMYNKGWELSVTHQNHIGDFNYSITGNISTTRNKVTSLGGGGAIFTPAHLGEDITITEVGEPVGSYYGWVADGIFQNQAEVDKSAQKGQASPGDIKFKDLNGDGVINAEDRTIIGNPWPTFTYGLTLTGNYKNFDLSVFFQGIEGNNDMDILRYDIESGTGWYNAPANFLKESWHGEGTTNKYYKISQITGINQNVSSYYVENGSYLRLKNVQLGYNFSKPWLKKIGIPQLRIYIASQNLLTFTKYSGLDPEIGSTGNGSGAPIIGDPKLQGIDQGVYPQPRTFMVGINAQF